MIKLKTNNRNRMTNQLKKVIIFIFFISLSLSFIGISGNLNYNNLNKNLNSIYSKKNLETSAVWASINITSYQLNNSRKYHNSTITIEGDLKYNNGTGVEYTEVAIFVDNVIYPLFMNDTDNFGKFQIDFVIPYSFDVYSVSGYNVQVNVTDNSRGKVTKENYLIIFANATSVLDLTYINSPYLLGELFNLNGFLKFDNINGNGIKNAQIDYYWYNSTFFWPLNTFFTSPFDGSISQNIQIPFDAYSDIINLNLTYFGDSLNGIDGSSVEITQIKLFNDMSCSWNINFNATEGDQFTISGELSSSKSSLLKLYNRSIRIFYDNNLINSVNTDNNGIFQYIYKIPAGTGNKSIRIELITTGGPYIYNSTNITILAGTTQLPSGPSSPAPFLGFAIIFFPILIGVITGLSIYGFYYFKKQAKESKVINLPLESKIINLKILKETGRLEESLSYLFNAIYMDLISAKYGRVRKINETIRDFAIVSVKQLNLKPSNIYPFIQKVEEIIYAKPFQITEKEFYSAIELFSPVYYELTGYNFVLNF
jgi:hypothetical protein